MPGQVQISRARGWRMPVGAVKVDRTTRWGNPFKVLKPRSKAEPWRVAFTPFRPGQARPDWAAEVEAPGHAGELEATGAAQSAFARWLGEPAQAELVEQARRELRGKDLACWCPIGSPCHRGVWIGLANAGG